MAQGDYGTPDNRVNITSERWKYTPHTSDPPDTEKGDEWLRVDMDSGDKIATLRFQYNSSGDVWDFPVYPTSETPGSQIKKKWRFDTPNGEGFVPLYEQGGTYAQRGFQINGTRHGVHDSLSAIPESENLHSRFDASQLSLSDGDAVSSWPDETGNNDLSGTATYGAADFNGNPTVIFDGSSDGLDTALDQTISQPFTVAAAIQMQSLTGSFQMFHNGTNSNDNDVGRMAVNDSDQWNINAGIDLDDGAADTNTNTYLGLYDGGSSILEVNNTQEASGDAGGRNMVSGKPYGLGYRVNTDEYFANVYVSEVLLYETGLDSQTRSNVHSYLADKWDITL